MSKPETYASERLAGATMEIISAMSSLNMDPLPIEGATGYLSETDHWAKHAMEHLHQANAFIADAMKDGFTAPTFPRDISASELSGFIDRLAFNLICEFDLLDKYANDGEPTLSYIDINNAAQYLKLAAQSLLAASIRPVE